MLLTVTGRRTGRPHTVTLMTLLEGDDFFAAASQVGVDREARWWMNLMADPRAQVEFRGERFPVVAEKVDGDERPAVWARFSAAAGGGRFDGYQAMVRREIAVIRLRRVR